MPRLSLLFLFLFAPVAVLADSEAPNRSHVVAGERGQCYARSLPVEYYGSEGRTEIYAVGTLETADEKIAELPLYARQLEILCRARREDGTTGIATALLGPWPRGHRPDGKTLALALYFDGERVARYSTLDIATHFGKRELTQKAVSCSVSHYQVVQAVEGFDWYSNSFALITVDGRNLVFDAATGQLSASETVDPEDGSHGACYWPEKEKPG